MRPRTLSAGGLLDSEAAARAGSCTFCLPMRLPWARSTPQLTHIPVSPLATCPSLFPPPPRALLGFRADRTPNCSPILLRPRGRPVPPSPLSGSTSSMGIFIKSLEKRGKVVGAPVGGRESSPRRTGPARHRHPARRPLPSAGSRPSAPPPCTPSCALAPCTHLLCLCQLPTAALTSRRMLSSLEAWRSEVWDTGLTGLTQRVTCAPAAPSSHISPFLCLPSLQRGVLPNSL